MKKYQILDHTADIRLRISGETFKALFCHGAEALYGLVTDAEKSGENEIEQKIILSAENAEELFLSWMKELLFLFSSRKYIFTDFEFSDLTEKSVNVSAKGKIFSPAKSVQKYEVKAITRHGYRLKKAVEGWTAEMTVDI